MKIKYELGFKSDTIDVKSVIQKHRLCLSAFSKLADLTKWTNEKVYLAIKNNSPDLKNAAINYSNRTKVSEKAFSQIKGDYIVTLFEIKLN